MSFLRCTGMWSVVLTAVATLSSVATATPRYSARYGQDCNLCHHDPIGGGKRNGYATQYLVPAEMSFVVWQDPERLERLDGQLNEAISLGADVRTLYLAPEDTEEQSDFFQMQADVYALVEVDPRFSLYLDQGQSETREVFGLGYVLPWNGFVKVGRFAPAYGWRFSDHSLYTRDLLGWAPPAHTDVGLQLGAYPGGGSVEVSVTNGSRGLPLDTDHRLSATARGGYRGALGPLSFAGGASYAYNRTDADLDRMAGPFGYLHFARVTWVGEVDWRRRTAGAAGGRDELVMSHELAFAMHRGVDLRLTYDFHDPDLDEKTGARGRYGIGIDTLLYPFLGVQAMVQIDSFEDGPAVAADERSRGLVLVHLLY